MSDSRCQGDGWGPCGGLGRLTDGCAHNLRERRSQTGADDFQPIIIGGVIGQPGVKVLIICTAAACTASGNKTANPFETASTCQTAKDIKTRGVYFAGGRPLDGSLSISRDGCQTRDDHG